MAHGSAPGSERDHETRKWAILQEVCPHNSPKFVQLTREEALRGREAVEDDEWVREEIAMALTR